VRFLLCLHLADGPRGPGGQFAPSLFVGCSSCSCSPFVSIRRGFEFSLGEVSDGPRVPGGRSAGVLRVLARLLFRSVVALSFRPPFVSIRRGFEFSLGEVSDGPRVPGFEFSLGELSDGPRVPGGRSAGAWRTVRYSGSSLEVLFAFSDGPRCVRGQSAAAGRTVRVARADGGRSARS
jgi:hypothetical protein